MKYKFFKTMNLVKSELLIKTVNRGLLEKMLQKF